MILIVIIIIIIIMIIIIIIIIIQRNNHQGTSMIYSDQGPNQRVFQSYRCISIIQPRHLDESH